MLPGMRLGAVVAACGMLSVLSLPVAVEEARADHLPPYIVGPLCAETATRQIRIEHVGGPPGPYGRFEPMNTTVIVGTTVTWLNNDTRNHKVKSLEYNGGEDRGWDSVYELTPTPSINDHYTIRLCATGLWKYHCPLCPDPVENCHLFQGNITAT